MIVEKRDRNALHGIFDSLDRAQLHLERNIPVYVNRGYFMDKTLRASDFEIIEDAGRG
jgi:hypothetical protein